MSKKDKFLMVFLTTITFGFIWIYWSKLKRNKENVLIKNDKLPFKIEELVKLLGGNENIENVENSISKIKIFLKDTKQIEVEKIKNLKGISGMVFSNFSISLVVGNVAEELCKQLTKSK